MPPPGYISSTEAIRRLGKGLYAHVEDGAIRKITPPGHKHGFYHEGDVETVRESERLFSMPYQRGQWRKNPASRFERATEADLPVIVDISSRTFGEPPPLETRLAWMRKEPECFYVLKDQAGEVKGYSSIIAVQREALERFVRDEISSDELGEDVIEQFRPGHDLHLYVMAIAIDPACSVAEKRTYGARLMTGLFAWILNMAERGVSIETITARTYKPDGLRMLRKMGIPQLRSPVPGKSLFSVRVPDSGFPLFERYSETLLLAQHRAAAPALPIAPRPGGGVEPKSPKRPEKAHRSEVLPAGSSELPDGLVSWRAFAVLHGIGETTIQHAVDHGRLPVIRSESEQGWKHGRAYVRAALDQAGRQEFYRLYSDHPNFKPCPDCPHNPE